MFHIYKRNIEKNEIDIEVKDEKGASCSTIFHFDETNQTENIFCTLSNNQRVEGSNNENSLK
jgi:hypothetical protein